MSLGGERGSYWSAAYHHLPGTTTDFVCSTYHDAARTLALVTGDEEYSICVEASAFQMPHELRGLFVTLILDEGPAPIFFRDYQDNLIEDICLRLHRVDAIKEALRYIDLKLQLHGKTNDQLTLPPAKHRQTYFERMKYLGQKTESGIPQPFRATVRYSRIYLGF